MMLLALLMAAAPHTVVVELFTSEGCSSCPPAEQLFAELRTQHAHQPVFFLSHHVDYWDRLGWRDPFSSAQATERQQQYTRAHRSDSLYTPQLVVDGRAAFVGSDGTRAQAAIAHANEDEDTITMSLSVICRANEVTVRYTSTGAIAQARLVAVIAEDDIRQRVTAGENAGRSLHHVGVVRVMREVPLRASGAVVLALPAPIGAAQVIVFAQDDSGILGAAEAVLPR